MKTFLVKEADLPNIGQNKLATMEIGTKFNHHGLCLDFTKAAGASMSEAEIIADVEYVSVALKVKDGPSIRLLKDIPAEVIFDILNKYREQTRSSYTYAGVLYIPWTREDLGLLVDPNALVIGMANIEHYTLHVKFKDVVPTTVKVGVLPEVDKGPARPLGEYIAFERWERMFASTGVENVTQLPYGIANTALLGYHIDLGATGVITDVEVRFDGELLHDPLNDAQNKLLLHRARRTPVAGYWHVDFNRKGSALPIGVAKSFRQKFNWSVKPDNYDVYTETVCNLGSKNYA